MDDISEQTNKEVVRSIEDLDVATAIQNDEVNNEEMQKADALENLEYADGKERDLVDLAEEEEKIYGVDRVSPFKTADTRRSEEHTSELQSH